jgi:thiamine-phosphate pyrophosphorylase
MLRVIPKLHVVTDDEILARPDFEARAREVFEVFEAREPVDEGVVGGSVALHIRGARTPGRRLTRLARILCERAAASGVLLVVNDRLDVALAVGAAGVHLGARSLPPAEARRLLGASRLLGVSVHSASEAVEVAESGADYLFVGTLFETPSHPEAVAGGPEFLGLVASRVDLPLVGIGGVTPERAVTVLRSGGHGVAAIRGIWDAPSPPDAVKAYLDAVEAGGSGDTSGP